MTYLIIFNSNTDASNSICYMLCALGCFFMFFYVIKFTLLYYFSIIFDRFMIFLIYVYIQFLDSFHLVSCFFTIFFIMIVMSKFTLQSRFQYHKWFEILNVILVNEMYSYKIHIINIQAYQNASGDAFVTIFSS